MSFLVKKMFKNYGNKRALDFDEKKEFRRYQEQFELRLAEYIPRADVNVGLIVDGAYQMMITAFKNFSQMYLIEDERKASVNSALLRLQGAKSNMDSKLIGFIQELPALGEIVHGANWTHNLIKDEVFDDVNRQMSKNPFVSGLGASLRNIFIGPDPYRTKHKETITSGTKAFRSKLKQNDHRGRLSLARNGFRLTSLSKLSQSRSNSEIVVKALKACRWLNLSDIAIDRFRLALIRYMLKNRKMTLYEVLKASHKAGVYGTENMNDVGSMYMSVHPLGKNELYKHVHYRACMSIPIRNFIDQKLGFTEDKSVSSNAIPVKAPDLRDRSFIDKSSRNESMTPNPTPV